MIKRKIFLFIFPYFASFLSLIKEKLKIYKNRKEKIQITSKNQHINVYVTQTNWEKCCLTMYINLHVNLLKINSNLILSLCKQHSIYCYLFFVINNSICMHFNGILLSSCVDKITTLIWCENNIFPLNHLVHVIKFMKTSSSLLSVCVC